MLDKNGIAGRLARADRLAEEQLNILKGLEHPALSDYESAIRNYILTKFLLDDEDVETDSLNELAEISVKKAFSLKPVGNEHDMLDISGHCGSVSSAATKKVLLLVALQKAMEVDLTVVNTAYIDTTKELAAIIMRLREER